MKAKHVILAILLVFSVWMVSGEVAAIETRRLDRVRDKSVLNQQDMEIIEGFIAGAVSELVNTADFSSISDIRQTIVVRRKSNRKSAQIQYSEQFTVSAQRHISVALAEAESLSSSLRSFRVTTNLLMLIDELGYPQLSGLALERTNSRNKVVRYRAIHAVTNSRVIEQINSGKADTVQPGVLIVQKLRELIDDASAQELELITDFAASVKMPQATRLLIGIADMRIKKYEIWTVDDMLLDATILKALCELAVEKSNDAPALGRRFGLLYSYAMQKYIRHLRGGDFLSESQKQQLASVLVETERSCIGMVLKAPQLIIRKAVGNGDYKTLVQQHDELLGTENKAGKVPAKLGFDYGEKDSNGTGTAPPELPPKPSGQ